MDETHADEFILASLPPLLCPARLRVGRGGVRGAKEGLSGRGMDLRFPKSPFQEKNDSEPCLVYYIYISFIWQPYNFSQVEYSLIFEYHGGVMSFSSCVTSVLTGPTGEIRELP